MDPSGDENDELRSRVRQQSVVADLGQRALDTDDVDRLLDDAAAAVADALGVDYCAIFESLPGDDGLRFRRGAGWAGGLDATATVPAGPESIPGRALDAGEPVVTGPGAAEGFSGSELLARHDVVSGISVAIGPDDAPADDARGENARDDDARGEARSEDMGDDDAHGDNTRDDARGEDGRVDTGGESTRIGPGGEGGRGGDAWGVLGAYATTEREFADHDLRFVREVADVLASAIANRRTTRDLELFRTLLDHSTESVFVIDPGTGAFLDVNETACRRTGYSCEELLERSVTDLETELPDREAWRSFVADLEAEGQLTFDGCHRRSDGTTYPVDVNATHVELDRRYVLAVARDVSERRERERELEQYRALTQAANDVVVTIDEDSIVRSVNPTVADVFGYDPEELVGESLTTLMPEEFAAGHREAIARYLETGEKTLDWNYVELTGRHADGSTIPLAVSFGEASFADERYFTGILRDVTERKKMQRRLEESNERLEQFAYATSHDLQEPLRMVSSYLELLDQRLGDDLDADARDFLEFAVDGAERMRAMIDGLLEYSRVETRGDSFTAVDLEAVLEDVLADLRLRIDESGAAIEAESLPVVEGDASQLRQVFQNVLDNAIEYSGDDPPRIRVAAERSGSEWTVSVADEGIGIDPEHTERVFEVFQRLHTREEHAGTGIGLALSRRIVERHGGDIWIDSTPGEGTTVSFTLPADDADA